MNRFRSKEFLAWALLMVSVYLLTIFILVRVMGLDTPQQTVRIVVTVIVETPTPVVTIPQKKPPVTIPCTPTKAPGKKSGYKPQTGGYTGTVVVPYSQPAIALKPHYTKPPAVHHPVLYKRKHCVYHHRHHHRRHQKHREKCHHKHKD